MDEKTVLLGKVGPTVILPRQGGQVVPLRQTTPLRVDVAGGGPVGLAFACTVKSLMGDQVAVRVHDRRWMRRGNRVVWRGEAEGNNRREQVVTLQSNVWAALPAAVQQRLFVPGKFSEMWPLGPDSPESKGRPRNIKIRWIEDALLDLAQDTCGIEVVPEAYVKPDRWDGLHVLAIAVGVGAFAMTVASAGRASPRD